MFPLGPVAEYDAEAVQGFSSWFEPRLGLHLPPRAEDIPKARPGGPVDRHSSVKTPSPT